MQCINITHPEYIDLENNSSAHPDALKAMISVWMDNNPNEDRYPTLDELNIPQKELFESNPELANGVYEALGFNNLRKEYSNLIIDQVWGRLASEGITNADSLIGTRDTINNKDFNKFWSSVQDVDIQNLIQFFESEKQKALDSYSKYKGEFNPTTGTFTSNDTSFFDNRVKDLNTLLQQKQFSKNVENIDSIIASEKTIRDLAARMADRIGTYVKFESDRTLDYKGKIENNVTYINLAYATLDTPIHEILGHPIIRALRNRKSEDGSIEEVNTFMADYWDAHPEKSREEVEKYVDENFKPTIISSQLYENLLKELETGKGKEVLDRIKRDYVNKNQYKKEDFSIQEDEQFDIDAGKIIKRFTVLNSKNPYAAQTIFKNIEDAQKEMERLTAIQPYTLEEQQEEAIVELLGLMTAQKLDAVKDGKLISLLKRLLKEIKQFIRSLLNQKEVEIDKLPDNMTLGDLSDLLAYSNSKLILPGYEVIYTTPDNNTFKTYQEASNHISELAKNVEDVDLGGIKVDNFQGLIGQKDKTNNKIVKSFVKNEADYQDDTPEYYDITYEDNTNQSIGVYELDQHFNSQNLINYIKQFIEKNKEYEQSKEIIEEWKKVNNIQYNPEEIYSRGQEFSSVVGAYSEFDVDLMMQNLLSHIEDNEKAGGKFSISAYTKPVDKKIGHLDGGGGKIKFNIYPKSEDILWAANTDVYSGSVWDASEKVNKDKKSELLGVSYTKYPSLRGLDSVQPNLAYVVDNLSYHHNELGISLTGNNFRLDYDDNVPYRTKKILDNINKILDQKYGKLVKPEITQPKYNNKIQEDYIKKLKQKIDDELEGIANDEIASDYELERLKKEYNALIQAGKIGLQPTQTRENTKSTSMVMGTLDLGKVEGTPDFFDAEITKEEYEGNITSRTEEEFRGLSKDIKPFKEHAIFEGQQYRYFDKEENAYFKNVNGTVTGDSYSKRVLKKEKEYTNQALINTKIATLKEAAKKYPRSLIRSEVKYINNINSRLGLNPDLWEDGELPFQKLPKSAEKVKTENSRVLNLSKANEVLDGSYSSEISEKQIKIIQGKISKINNELAKNEVKRTYKIENVKRVKGKEAFTWKLKEIDGFLNIEEKIARTYNPDLNKLNSAKAYDLGKLAKEIDLFTNKVVEKPKEKYIFIDMQTHDYEIYKNYIYLNDTPIGTITLSNYGTHFNVENVNIKGAYQRQGVGTAVYKYMGNWAEENGLRLRSHIERHESSEGMWKKLAKQGLATLYSERYYFGEQNKTDEYGQLDMFYKNNQDDIDSMKIIISC